MFGTVLGVLSALVSAGVGIYSAYQSKKQQDLAAKTSQENFNLQQAQFEYQKDLNNTVMDREDNSMQRQVSDLKAAGISPLALTNGASATPLTSANAPLHDISGIQTALQNQLGAFNDIFNRRLARQQFALQSKVQKAQMYTQLAELAIQRKTAEKQNKLLDLDYTYYLNHPERNLGLQSMIGNLISKVIGNNGSSVIPSPEALKGSLNLDLSGIKDSISIPNNSNPVILATPKQIKKDTKIIENQEKVDLQHARDILYNYQGKDYEYKSLSYFYYHTNAWRDYKSVNDFKNALLKSKNKSDILQKYPYIEREPLKLGL